MPVTQKWKFTPLLGSLPGPSGHPPLQPHAPVLPQTQGASRHTLIHAAAPTLGAGSPFFVPWPWDTCAELTRAVSRPVSPPRALHHLRAGNDALFISVFREPSPVAGLVQSRQVVILG